MDPKLMALRAAMAQASYAALGPGLTLNGLMAALQTKEGGFTLTQAKRFAADQSVVLQYNDDAPGAGTGHGYAERSRNA